MTKDIISKAIQTALEEMLDAMMLSIKQVEDLKFKGDDMYVCFDDGEEKKVKGISKSELMGDIGLAGDSIEDLYFEGEYLYYTLDDGKPKKVKGFKKSDFQGKDGTNGKDGRNGLDGKDGKDADIKTVKPIIEKEVKAHEKKFNHELLHDSKLVGTKEIDESDIADGKFMRYDAKKDKIVYDTMQQVANQLKPYYSTGYRLPSQTGNTGKVLTSGGANGSETWEFASGGGGVTDGDKGDIVVSGGGSTWNLDPSINSILSLASSSVQQAFKTISVSGQNDIVAETATDTLTLVAGANVTITTDDTTDTLTISATGGGSGSQEVFVQDTEPTPTGPALWIQTGLARGGHTVWFFT